MILISPFMLPETMCGALLIIFYRFDKAKRQIQKIEISKERYFQL